MTTGNQPPDQHERDRIVDLLDDTMLVEASAGTGKTTSMIQRMVALAAAGKCEIERMAAVTFTRKAAAELRSRFQVALERAAREARGKRKDRLVHAQAGVQRGFIGTIHAFCSRLLRERPIEAAVDLDFKEMEPDEDIRLRRRAWSEFVAQRFASNNPIVDELREVGLEFGQIRDAFLDYTNYPDVDCWPAPRIDLGDLQHLREQLLAYVDDMEQLIPSFPHERGNDKLMDTYERVVRLVRQRDLDHNADLFEILEEFRSSRNCVMKSWPASHGRRERDRWRNFCNTVAEPLVDQWFAARYAVVMRVFAGANDWYEALKNSEGKLNYQDLLMKAAAMLRDNPAIRHFFRERFSHLLVDEFQDTDPVQAEIMMLLTADDEQQTNWRKCRPASGSLFVVGDPKQSIYRFRRADIVTYKQVKDMIEDAGGVIVTLSSNFRTLPELVDWGNASFAKLFPQQQNTHSPAASPMDAGREQQAASTLQGLHRLAIPAEHSYGEQVTNYEADLIARYIRHALDCGATVDRTDRELQAGVSPAAQPGDFMIIARNKKHLFDYGRALQRLGVPHEVTGSSALSQVSELQMVLDCLAALAEPENSVALVAVLRGPLFGMSDVQLYEYQQAGGRFAFRVPPPEQLAESPRDEFAEAFERLQTYERWLRQLPAVPAIEKIVFDLGLPMRALAGEEGDAQGGSIAKALQLMRAAETDFHSIDDALECLRGLMDEKAEYDGMPVRPHSGSAVRIMNLHKAKGLEAPVVFLADPTGKWDPPIKLYIDRLGEQVQGFMAIHARRKNFHDPFLAKPINWEEQKSEEKAFDDHEENRLLYVATTRAGTQLTIVQRTDSRAKANHWQALEPYLATAESLADPGPQRVALTVATSVPASDIHQAAVDSQERWKNCSEPTYATAAAKHVALSTSKLRRPATAGEHGTEWGTVIHFLLETAMREPDADLKQLAYSALEDQQLEAARVDEALQTVQRVRDSQMWERAQASSQVLVEVPFARCLTAEGSDRPLPTVLRGVVDLVFREDAGWVLVDYKTDASAREDLEGLVDQYRRQVLLYAEAWEQTVGQAVAEKALFFTAADRYVVL